MEYRINKKTSEKVSLLGMGCMRFPLTSEKTEDIDQVQVQQMVDYAYENGINYFDTAYPYHGGKSEASIGKALAKYPRESFYLADKMPIWKVEKPEELDIVLSEQLQRTGVSYFDYYLFHAVDKTRFEKVKELDMYNWAMKKKSEGVLKNVGFSFHDAPSVLRDICTTYKWDFVQLQINYLDWDLGTASELYEIANEFDLQIVVMEPVRGGALASLGSTVDEIFKKADSDASVASWAIRYVASLPSVLSVLSGMSNFAQVQDNIKTMTNFIAMSEQELNVVENALDEYKKAKTIPCTGCRYCMDCPFGVQIPEIFTIHNDGALMHGAKYFETQMQSMPEIARPTSCVACGACAEVCPQKIDIPSLMQGFAKGI